MGSSKDFGTWLYYSGELVYPIPSTINGSPKECYMRMRKTTKGMYCGEYGRLRRNLSDLVY
ncbi:hypothetical protein 65p378 [Aeromonas phage 65]|uniref:Uncharacterized protein n=1 Tax=Aeromonas phage 65 TaxID=2919549 RepID=E5DSL2_9CAUD|nr:hypothetical protein ST65p378 [Aeromonas phage 65]ADQ53446.1 hypothetical protein 65p378 [Aeromonas phage 65]